MDTPWCEFDETDFTEDGEPTGIATEKKKDKKWSGAVTKNEKWHPPEGLFKESPDKIAKVLKANSDSKKQAISRVTFYLNRAGKNLSKADKERIGKAKEKLKELYADEEKESKTVSKESWAPSAEW